MLLRSSRFPPAAFLIALVPGTPLMAQTLVGDGTIICGDTYVVESGDTLSELAQSAYGSSDLYDRLIEANSEQLDRADMLAVGMEISIPCLDTTGEPADVEIATAVNADGPLSAGELDALFGPVALFPDPLLNPILLAVTMPLDVVKAARFVEESADLTDEERASAASDQDWDPSVRTLAAAYPDLVTKMSDHIDWTEQAGEAVLAQTDDVLDAIQRLRSEAMDNGYLVDNQAQDVEVTDDVISIASAEPQVIYVPTYDPQVVYTTPVSAPPAYYFDDDYEGYHYDDDWNDALAGGAIFLGSAIVLDEIFDDDDWDDIGGWDGDDIDVDWDGGDINIDRGDINIDGGDNTIIGSGDRVTISGGDRTNITGGDRIDIGEGDRTLTGDRERTGELPTGAADRDAARQRIEARQTSGADVALLPATRQEVTRPRAETRPSTGNRDTNISRPNQDRRPTAATQQVQQPQRQVRQDNAFAREQRPSNRQQTQTRNRRN